ncbi:hypothetical protein SECTIM467_153 [Brevibacillus phage SecTim467]|uniref:Uncharacterized protein n=2 Tax=Jenstvirus jenst TaxID=1982225 RepID=A0A0K2CP37_9CAUD|nr:hypothetical protein AVV11_gp043 [Brevibacillus phage Jenst]ALA07277.1 hypothetical protein JENST_148 [Brevibacillus phage Jenst]ALA07592.1 hypothetical protein SECTIM467_153 [Brevibacillus phage SecTim467]
MLFYTLPIELVFATIFSRNFVHTWRDQKE